MLREHWQRARSILDRALELDAVERAAFVAGECGEDIELRREVDALLELEPRVRFEPPTPAALASAALRALPPNPAPRRIGPYELVEPIGAGGMGSVWRARRAEGFEQVVAIKLIKRGMDTDEVLRRFETERAVLATLQHDGIARLFDGGATDDGVPYLVMEFVDGTPIDRFCADRELSVRAKVELVLAVCDAVQFAHEHLVVHRDLKPSNILVTRTGVPKLLDFGIAKVLSDTGAEHAVQRTDTGQRVFTPTYASPEQLRGEALATQSDVFSLGLVLWELLVGRRAFDRERLPDSEPTRASLALASTSGSRRAARKLAGDLDTILARACHAERSRRYGSIEAFAGDLRLYLADQPVRAQPDSLAYRASKFARRNKLVVGSFSAILIAFATAAGVSLRMVWRTDDAREREREQREIAERRFAETRKLATTFLFEVHDSIRYLPGATEARATLLSTALDTLDRLTNERSDQAELNMELFEAYTRLASIYSDASSGSLEEFGNARDSLEKARALAERFPADSAERNRLVGIVEYKLGDLHFVFNERTLAAEHFERAAEILARVPLADHSFNSWENLGAAYARLAQLARFAHQPLEAGCWLDLAVLHHRSHPVPNDENELYHLAVVLQERGCVSDDAGDGDGAVSAKRAALGILEDQLGRHPEMLPCRNSVALVAASLSKTLAALGRADEALECAARAADLQRVSAYQDPEDATAARLLQNNLQLLGVAQLELEHFERAGITFAEAVAVGELRTARDATDFRPLWDLNKALVMHAASLARRELWSQSADVANEALATGDRVLVLAGPSYDDAVASYRLEFAAHAAGALAAAREPVDPPAARRLLALAGRMADSAKDGLERSVSTTAAPATHRVLLERVGVTCASIEELSLRYGVPQE
jgi:serine/threonine protein kinase